MAADCIRHARLNSAAHQSVLQENQTTNIMPSTTYTTIREAILAKQNISAEYKGYPRIMTPHTLGCVDEVDIEAAFIP